MKTFNEFLIEAEAKPKEENSFIHYMPRYEQFSNGTIKVVGNKVTLLLKNKPIAIIINKDLATKCKNTNYACTFLAGDGKKDTIYSNITIKLLKDSDIKLDYVIKKYNESLVHFSLIKTDTLSTTKDIVEFAKKLEPNIKTAGFDIQYIVKNNSVNIVWDLTFRRNTFKDAMKLYKNEIDRANSFLYKVHNELKSLKIKSEVSDFTMANVKKMHDDTYSEYEQSMSGEILIKL